jgi:hypothetical protein
MAGFGDQLRKITEDTKDKMDLAFRKIALDMFTEVILRTPVDKGGARANWRVAIGEVPHGTLDLNDVSGQATISKAAAKSMSLKAGDTIYLANSLPYIKRLMNDGWSQQAPAGAFDLVVQRYNVIAGRAIAEIARQ